MVFDGNHVFRYERRGAHLTCTSCGKKNRKFLFSDGEASLCPDCFAEELWHANGRGYGCRDVLTTGGQCHAARLGFMNDEVDGKERPAHVI